MTDYYLAVRPYGDSLISLSLLHRLPPRVRLQIFGTPLVEEVAAVTGLSRFPVRPVLPDVAGFFNVRVNGVRHAFHDLRVLREALARSLSARDTLLVEQQDWRNRFILPVNCGRLLQPAFSASVYLDRCEMLARYFGAQIELPDSRMPSRTLSSLVIHPGARQRARTLPHAVVSALLDYAATRGLATHLIDRDRRYSDLAPRTGTYLAAPSLREAVACLRASDFFIGADSFFLHLAYFYNIPLFGIGETRRPYFSPPGMVEQGASMMLDDARNRSLLFMALDRLLN